MSTDQPQPNLLEVLYEAQARVDELKALQVKLNKAETKGQGLVSIQLGPGFIQRCVLLSGGQAIPEAIDTRPAGDTSGSVTLAGADYVDMLRAAIGGGLAAMLEGTPAPPPGHPTTAAAGRVPEEDLPKLGHTQRAAAEQANQQHG